MVADDPSGFAGRSSRAKILVVDDDRGIRRSLERLLAADYEVRTAERPEEAIEILEEETGFTVLLVDYQMPTLNGVQLLRRATLLAPQAVKILMSGYAELREMGAEVEDCDLYTYVPKPFDVRALRLILQRARERHELDARNRVLREQLEEQATRERTLRQAFQQYVPPEVVDQLVEGGGPASVVSIKRDVSVLIVDLRSFTTFVEEREPAVVVGYLNQLFAIMAEPILRFGGTIDKYMGDAILAHFGGLRPDRRSADRAVAAALNIRRDLRAADERFAQQNMPAFECGIAVSTGPCVVGNVGCIARMDHTVIGDAVNVAARLEELTKQAPDSILISGATRERLSVNVETRRWPEASLRGRKGEVEVWEVLEMSVPPSLARSALRRTMAGLGPDSD
ncbi:MAG: adenylate/guanylate cyclase domain-containing protein [Myxococcota bacterium]